MSILKVRVYQSNSGESPVGGMELHELLRGVELALKSVHSEPTRNRSAVLELAMSLPAPVLLFPLTSGHDVAITLVDLQQPKLHAQDWMG